MDDRSWVGLPRNSAAFFKGVDDFLNFAYANKQPDSDIYCPCKVCANRFYRPRNIVREHIILEGFLKRYKKWTYHGESYISMHQNREQERADISMNKRNREHQVYNHTTRRKKHAQARKEMEDNRKETDRVNVFIETSKPKEGRPQALETAAAIAETKSQLDIVPVEERTTSFKEKVFTDVVEPDVRGRVKTYRASTTLRTVFGTEAGMQIRSKDIEMEQRIVEKVYAKFASLLDSRIAEMINLFRSRIERESRRVGDGPSSVGNQVLTSSSVHPPNSEVDGDAYQDDEVMERD